MLSVEDKVYADRDRFTNLAFGIAEQAVTDYKDLLKKIEKNLTKNDKSYRSLYEELTDDYNKANNEGDANTSKKKKTEMDKVFKIVEICTELEVLRNWFLDGSFEFLTGMEGGRVIDLLEHNYNFDVKELLNRERKSKIKSWNCIFADEEGLYYSFNILSKTKKDAIEKAFAHVKKLSSKTIFPLWNVVPT